MIAKEFAASKATKTISYSLIIVLAIVLAGLLPVIFDFFKYSDFGTVNLISVGVVFIPLLISFLSTVRKYSVNRKYLYIHKLFWRTKFKLKNLLDIETKPERTETKYSLKWFMKRSDLLSINNQNQDRKIGNYQSFVTDPEKMVLLIFKDKKVAVSPESPEMFIGFVRNFIEY